MARGFSDRYHNEKQKILFFIHISCLFSKNYSNNFGITISSFTLSHFVYLTTKTCKIYNIVVTRGKTVNSFYKLCIFLSKLFIWNCKIVNFYIDFIRVGQATYGKKYIFLKTKYTLYWLYNYLIVQSFFIYSLKTFRIYQRK